MDDVNGKILPVITAAFWGDKNAVYALEDEQSLSENGLFLIEHQLMTPSFAIESLSEHNEMDANQVNLLKSLYEKLMINPNQKIKLTQNEINIIRATDEDGIKASKEAFSEIGIEWA